MKTLAQTCRCLCSSMQQRSIFVTTADRSNAAITPSNSNRDGKSVAAIYRIAPKALLCGDYLPTASPKPKELVVGRVIEAVRSGRIVQEKCLLSEG